MLHTREKGNVGEDIACKFLVKNGFNVIDRNYYKKWGELDVVAKRGNELHFFEVKSVMRKFVEKADKSFSYFHDPEENVHIFKTHQLSKIIQTYLVDKGLGLDHFFQFHILSVFMDEKTHLARVKWIKNVIL